MLRVSSARLTRQLQRPVGVLSRIGERTSFSGKAIRLTAEISKGAGTLASIGAEADPSWQLEVGVD